MVIDRDEAERRAVAALAELPTREELVILHERTLEKPRCWSFVYNTKRFVDTNDHRHALAGNGPLLVNREDGAVVFGPSRGSLDEILAQYERGERFQARGQPMREPVREPGVAKRVVAGDRAPPKPDALGIAVVVVLLLAIVVGLVLVL